MRFFADENISPIVVGALRAAGHDALSATIVMPGAPDEDVMERAFAEARILVTEDKDFGELAFKHRRRSVGVIRLVLPG